VYCDALTLSAVADELREELLGGRIQRAVLLDRLAMGLEVYAQRQRQYLLISARPEEGGRAHLVQHKLRRGPRSATPLWLRLRKYVRSSHLTAVQQPPAERILRFTIDGAEGVVVLVVETMGRRSNIILVDEDGSILECAKHVPASQNRFRVLLPGHLYVPPPAQKKADALALTPSSLARLLAEQDPALSLRQKLVASLRGISPLLAREVVYRVSGDAESQEGDASGLLAQLQGLLGLAVTGKWQPSVALQDGQIVAYAPYELTQYAVREVRGGISEAMAAYYAQRAGTDPYAVAKSRLLQLIEQQRGRQRRKREALGRSQPTPARLEELRKRGELLLAYAHQVSSGQEHLVVDLGPGEPPVEIALDPLKSAVENAQEYFRRYDKAKSAAAEVPRLLARVDAELAYLDQLATDLALAEDQPGIAAVEMAMAQAGYLARAKGRVRAPKASPLRVLSDEGFVILVGRNSWQNEQLTFHRSAASDVWLHAQGVPGAHVLIRTEGRDAPGATLQRAAELAAYFSAARHDGRVSVDYTLCKNVRRLKGGKTGQVMYRGQKTVVVTPQG
jgi:predicted ribosome quality control (RQC) complex YloA/Tae2 family protein